MLSTESLRTRCPPSRLRFRTVLLCIAIQRYKLVKKFESWLQGVDLKGPQAREDGFREFGCRFPVSNVFHAVRRDLLTAFVSSSLGLPFSIDWKGIQLHSASSLEGILIEQTHQENREAHGRRHAKGEDQKFLGVVWLAIKFRGKYNIAYSWCT